MSGIKIHNFQKNYKNQTLYFDQIRIEKRITLLYGKNGKGKSTILKAIAQLIQYQGKIEHPYDLGFLPEELILPMHLKVSTFLQMILPKKSLDHMKYWIQNLQMGDHVDKYIEECSKGMKKKIGLIYILSLEKDIILLDEPFVDLDQESVKSIINFMNHSNKMFVLSSHLCVQDLFTEIDVITL
jgi:ABC-2 type transport system ATP-binding protein